MKIASASMLVLTLALTGCGGGGSSSGSSSSSASTSTTIAAGSSYTMAASQSVNVPAGTTVTAPNGSVVTVNGTQDTIVTQVGAVVSVPAAATGAAGDVVTTDASAKGVSTLPITVVALAGSATNNMSQIDGTGAAAVLSGGGNLALAPGGNIIFSDRGGLRQVTAAGVVTTFSAAASVGWGAIAVDSNGDVYGSTIDIMPTSAGGIIFDASINEFLASGTVQSVYPDWETGGGYFIGSGSLALDGQGHLYFADANSDDITQFTLGSTEELPLAGNGEFGSVDGVGAGASFSIPTTASDMPTDAAGNLYLNDNQSIRRVSATGVVKTLFTNLPTDNNALAIDQEGNFYVADSTTLTRVSPSGTITTYPLNTSFNSVCSMVLDGSGALYLGTRGTGAQILKVIF